MTRNIAEAAQRLASAYVAELVDIAMRDPDMIRDVAGSLLAHRAALEPFARVAEIYKDARPMGELLKGTGLLVRDLHHARSLIKDTQ